MLSENLHIQVLKWLRLLSLLAFSLHMGNVFAQSEILQKQFDFKNSNSVLENVLNDLSKQIGYNFIYNASLIAKNKKVSIHAKQKTLHEILNNIFSDSTLTYQVIDKYIVVLKSGKTALIKTIFRTDSAEYFILKGKVIDASSHVPLPFASIGLIGTSLGTIANETGQFSIKILKSHLSSVLSISHLGYISLKIPVEQISENLSIFPLERDIISLQEIIIRNPDPLNLIRTAIKNIPVNYVSKAASMSGFYRETIMKDKQYAMVAEAALSIYRPAMNSVLETDQVRIVKSRKYENSDLLDTLIIKLKAGLNSCLMLDVVKQKTDFLKEENFKDYRFGIPDITKFDGQSAYVISFEQEATIEEPFFTGQIYISMHNYAILGASYEINRQYIEKLKNELVVKNKSRFNIVPTRVAYRISYRLLGDKYILSHSRGEIELKVKKKKQLFARNYSVLFEMITSDADTLNVKRFKKTETGHLNGIFSEAVGAYDENFWGNENTIQPEEPLEKALRKISRKIVK